MAVSPEPLVSCAQAPPAKGHDGPWGRECVREIRRKRLSEKGLQMIIICYNLVKKKNAEPST